MQKHNIVAHITRTALRQQMVSPVAAWWLHLHKGYLAAPDRHQIFVDAPMVTFDSFEAGCEIIAAIIENHQWTVTTINTALAWLDLHKPLQHERLTQLLTPHVLETAYTVDRIGVKQGRKSTKPTPIQLKWLEMKPELTLKEQFCLAIMRGPNHPENARYFE
jgi:hypothetical protein